MAIQKQQSVNKYLGMVDQEKKNTAKAKVIKDEMITFEKKEKSYKEMML